MEHSRMRTLLLLGLTAIFLFSFASIGLGGTDKSVPRSFELSDQSDYPGKFNLFIHDQPVDQVFMVYIYVTTPGGTEKDDAAENVMLSMYDDQGHLIQSWGPFAKPKRVENIAVPIRWPENIYVTLEVTGTILKNGKDVENATGYSNFFWIGTPAPPPPPPSQVGQLLWEKEIIPSEIQP